MKEYDNLLDSGLSIHLPEYYLIIEDCLAKLTLEQAKFFIVCALCPNPDKKFDAFRLLFNLEYFYDQVQKLKKSNCGCKVSGAFQCKYNTDNSGTACMCECHWEKKNEL